MPLGPVPSATYAPVADPPPGAFAAISVGGRGACALTSEAEAVCWGDNEYGQLDVPPGRYTAISKSKIYTCALTEAGDAVCWGGPGAGQLDPPAGRYTAITATVGHACALAEDGEAVCWGYSYGGQTDPPPGPYMAISVGFFGYHGSTGGSCGLTGTGEMRCWGLTATAPLDGRFTALSYRGTESCGLKDDGELVCRQSEAPPGSYTAVSIGAPSPRGLCVR